MPQTRLYIIVSWPRGAMRIIDYPWVPFIACPDLLPNDWIIARDSQSLLPAPIGSVIGKNCTWILPV